jgi:hypothetical protein
MALKYAAAGTIPAPCRYAKKLVDIPYPSALNAVLTELKLAGFEIVVATIYSPARQL